MRESDGGQRADQGRILNRKVSGANPRRWRSGSPPVCRMLRYPCRNPPPACRFRKSEATPNKMGEGISRWPLRGSSARPVIWHCWLHRFITEAEKLDWCKRPAPSRRQLGSQSKGSNPLASSLGSRHRGEGRLSRRSLGEGGSDFCIRNSEFGNFSKRSELLEIESITRLGRRKRAGIADNSIRPR